MNSGTAELIRVLFMIAEYDRISGGQQSLLQLVRRLPEVGVEPLVCFPKEGRCSEAYREAGIPMERKAWTRPIFIWFACGTRPPAFAPAFAASTTNECICSAMPSSSPVFLRCLFPTNPARSAQLIHSQEGIHHEPFTSSAPRCATPSHSLGRRFGSGCCTAVERVRWWWLGRYGAASTRDDARGRHAAAHHARTATRRRLGAPEVRARRHGVFAAGERAARIPRRP